FFQAEDGIRDRNVTGVQTCALPISFTPALTYSTLAKKVQFGIAKDALERRRSMDNVVIMDKGTHSFEKDSKCVLLAMALFKVYRSEERRVGKECSTRWVA